MRIAVVNETSAVDKHPFIMSALEGRGLDMVIGGCGTGQGYMNSVMQYRGVVYGHLLTPLDAFLLARINAGNVVSLALKQGWARAGEVNPSMLSDQLFGGEQGSGFPAHRAQPQAASRGLLGAVAEASHRCLSGTLKRLPDEIVRPAITHPAAAPVLDIPTISDEELRAALQARLSLGVLANPVDMAVDGE